MPSKGVRLECDVAVSLWHDFLPVLLEVAGLVADGLKEDDEEVWSAIGFGQRLCKALTASSDTCAPVLAAVYQGFGTFALAVGDLNEFFKSTLGLASLCRAQHCAGTRDLGLGSAALGHLLVYFACVKRDMIEFNTLLRSASEPVRLSDPVRFSLAVQRALVLGNYVAFARLHSQADGSTQLLMERALPEVRPKAIACIAASYLEVPLSLVSRLLSFRDEKSMNEFLIQHGCGDAIKPAEQTLDCKKARQSLR